MTLFFSNLASIGQQAAMDQIRSCQPSFDIQNFFNDPKQMIERIKRYIENSFKCCIFLRDYAPQKLEKQTVKLLTVALSGGVACLMFTKAVLEGLVGVLFISPTFVISAGISLLIAYGSGYLSLHVAKELDVQVRYDALTSGYVYPLNSLF